MAIPRRASFADAFMPIISACACIALFAPGWWCMIGFVGFVATFGYAMWKVL